MPFLSFIVGFRNRDPVRVKLFLEQLTHQTEKDFELIFVDYGSDEPVSEEVKNLVSKYPFAHYHFFNSRGQLWNRAKCLNVGASLCSGQYYFTADVDFLFSPVFVKNCRSLCSSSKASYFKVAYLSEDQSANLRFPLSNYKIAEFSTPDAIGSLLISKHMFESLGGYDEFFEIWGLEDNDLLHRIRNSQHNIDFYTDEILIWHLWHLPAKRSGELPQGWLTFLSDYFRSKKNGTTNHNFYCLMDRDRPVLQDLAKFTKKVQHLDCGPYFLRHFLENEIRHLGNTDFLELHLNFAPYHGVSKVRINSWLGKLNSFFLKRKVPFKILNRNMDAYMSEAEAKDALVYFIKNNSEVIRDYYLPKDLSKHPFLLLMR